MGRYLGHESPSPRSAHVTSDMDSHHVVWVCSEFSTLDGGIRERGIASPGDGLSRRRHFHGLDMIQQSRSSADDSKQLAALRDFTTSVVRMPGCPYGLATWQALQDSCSAQFDVSVQELCADTETLGLAFGVLLLTPPKSYTGLLQLLSPEEEFLFEFHGRPNQWHSLSVAASMELANPMKISWSNSQLKPASSWFTLSRCCIESLLAAPAMDGRCMHDVIGSWSQDHGLELEQASTCLQLWPPIARLALRARWHTIFLRQRVRVEAGPSAEWLAAHGRCSKRPRHHVGAPGPPMAPQQPRAEADVGISPHVFRNLARQLRLLGAAAANNFPQPPDRDEFEAGLEFDIKYLMQLADSHESSSSVLEQHGRFGTQVRYNLTYLIRILFGSRLLRSKGKTKEVFLAAARACLPVQIASDMEKLISKQPIPGPATMSHCEFITDVTLMMLMRTYHSEVLQADELPVVFAKFDSSPQGGVDWMNSQWVLIEGRDVGDFFAERTLTVQHSDRICGLCKILEEDGLDVAQMADLEATVAEQMELLELMRESLHVHFCVPVGPLLVHVNARVYVDPFNHC